jgi:hypothetical protein
MELLDRYLQAVKKHLPWQRQDDIFAELKANLESQLEDKEAELGRPLTDAEAETWLKQIGPPILVAARYQPHQYLIGPALFPTYWYVLRTALLWGLIIYSIVNAVLVFAGSLPDIAEVVAAVFRVPGVLMTVAAWVTLVFACFEFAHANFGAQWPPIPGFAAGASADWTPSTLPPLDKQTADGCKPRSYAKAVAEVIFGFLFLIWLLLIPHYPFLLWGPGAFYMRASAFQLAPVWMQFYWWVVAMNMVQLVWRFVNLFSGAWQNPHPAWHIFIKAIGIIPLVVLLTAPGRVFVSLKHPAVDQARYGAALDLTNRSIHRGFLCVLAIVVLQLAWEIGYRIFGAYRKAAAKM